MIVNVIPLSDHHECYRAEDIELWEVRRISEISKNVFNKLESNCKNSLIVNNWGNLNEINIKINEIDLLIKQDIDGIIGSVLWPSSVIGSRLLLLLLSFL